LAKAFTAGADRKSLELYLEGFAYTVAVMQTASALQRVAREAVEDLADDGVVYAELRFAPELCVHRGLSLDEVVQSVVAGLREGEQVARSKGQMIVAGAILCAMRMVEPGDVAARGPESVKAKLINTSIGANHPDATPTGAPQGTRRDPIRSLTIAQLAVRYRHAGVVGFDIAGAEAGYPPQLHRSAFEYAGAEKFPVTIHAGESFGVQSISSAIDCGARRLGHGVRVTDEIELGADGTVHFGKTATYVLDSRVPLEVCPTSNVHTGVSFWGQPVQSVAEHPIKVLFDLGFRVTLNTDNRLMSGVSMTSEMTALADAFGWGLNELEWLTVDGMKSAFLGYHTRKFLQHRIQDEYRRLRDELGVPTIKRPDTQLQGPARDVLLERPDRIGQPGVGESSLLVGGNGVGEPQREADVVQPFQQSVLREGVHLEGGDDTEGLGADL
jgi:adenosine deaminase